MEKTVWYFTFSVIFIKQFYSYATLLIIQQIVTNAHVCGQDVLVSYHNLPHLEVHCHRELSI